MAPTKSAGRVSIRVLPDSSRFREDLKKALDRIEKSMTVKIQVIPVLDKKQLADMKRQIEALAIKIKPDIDLTITQEEIEKIKARIEAMNPTVEVNTLVNTAEAANRIQALTRDKLVNIVPQITRTAAKNFSQHLAAIAGASIIAAEITKGMNFLRTIDAHALRIAKQAASVGMVISMAGAAAQAVIGLGDGLIKTLGVVSVVPALMSSMGIAIAVFSVALKDMKTVLADLGPAFSQLARDMSFKFWDEAAEPIREMVNHLMPTLSEKMLLASTSMGKLTGQIAKSYKEHVTIEKFATMFDRVVESMDTVRGAVDPIIEAFTILGMHGTKYLNRLSKAIVTVTEDFRDWLKASDENGNLDKWTEDGITSFKELGGIIKGVWNVFGALNTAIKEAGGPTLADFHRAVDNAAATMSSPDFQMSMTAVFRGMNTAVVSVAEAIGRLGPTLKNLAPTIERSFMMIGETFSVLIGYFGEIMGHPAVTGGINDFFESILKSAKNLAPAIEPFSLALGSLLTLLGTVLENVAALVATIMDEWGPSLQTLSDTFDTLAEPLRVMLEDVVKALTPAIKVLVDEAIVPLLEWIRDHLIPAVSDFARDSGPELARIMGEVAGVITEHVIPALTILTDLFTDSDGEASTFKKTLDDLKQLINDPEAWVMEFDSNYMEFSRGLDNFIIDWWDGMVEDAKAEIEDTDSDNLIGDWFIDLGKGIAKKIKEMWNNIDWAPNMEGKNNLWDGIKEKWGDLEKMWGNFWDNFMGGDDDAPADWENKLGAENFELATAGIDVDLGKMLENFETWYNDFSAGWDGFWGDTKISAAEWGTETLEGFSTWWDDTSVGFSEWWTGVTDGWDGFWGGLGESADTWGTEQKASLSTWWTETSEGFSEWWTGVTEGWDGFWGGLGESLSTWWAERKEGFSTWWTETSEGFAEWWTGITEGWDGFWTGLGETLSTWWEERKEGFNTWWTGISEGFTTWWEGIKEGWNNFWSGLGENAATWWEDIKTGIATKTQEIADGIRTKLEEMGIDTDSGWSIIKGLTQVAWDNLKTWLGEKWQEIKDNAKTWLSGMGIDVDGGWTTIKSNTSTKWQEIKQGIADKWNEIVNYIPGKLREFGTNVQNGFEVAKQYAKQKMQELKEGIIQKGQEAVEWIKGLPGRMRDAMTGQSLESSGSSMIQGFTNGMIKKANEAYESAKGILAKIRGLFPNSPAKEGPFSGKGWTPYSGAALMTGFADGMSSKMGVVTKVAKQMHTGVANEISSIKASAPDVSADGQGSSSGGNMTVNIYNPIAEASSKTINRKSSMIKLGGSLS